MDRCLGRLVPMCATLNKLDRAEPFKVVVVDDSPTMRRWIGSVISRDARLHIVGMAGTAEEARAVIKATNPDVLTLDIEMPGMDGLEFLTHLMRLRPMPVVMLANRVDGKSSNSNKAMQIGAAACMAKPSFPTQATINELCEMIVSAATGILPAKSTSLGARRPNSDKILLVGASTGGVSAIESLLKNLPKDSPPLVIAQHMPHTYLRNFVERLDRMGTHSVGFAEAGMRLDSGTIQVSPSQGMQTCVAWSGGAWHVQNVARDDDHAFCPSVDVLFASGVPWAPQVGAAILTGLGRDGARGMLALRQNGARTIAQSRESCVVYGMPGAAQSLNASEDEAPIDDIAPKLLARMLEPKPHRVAQ